MNPLLTVLRLIHILGGVYWAGTMFFFVTFLEPTLRSLGPDGGKVMIRLFERGYTKVLPAIAITTILSGFWMLWILSSGFKADYMGSTIGISLSTGGTFALVALLIGLIFVRPAADRIWAIARQLGDVKDEATRAGLMAEMQAARAKTVGGSRVVFALLIGAVALMAIARYI